MHYFQDIDRSIYQDKASDKNDPKIITKLQIKEGKIIFVHCKHVSHWLRSLLRPNFKTCLKLSDVIPNCSAFGRLCGHTTYIGKYNKFDSKAGTTARAIETLMGQYFD